MPSSDDPKRQISPGSRRKLSGELDSLGMDDLLKMYDESMAEFAEGDIVRGRVLQVNATEVVVDIGYKSEGTVPIEQVTSADGTVGVKPGDEIEVYIEKLEDTTGRLALSKERAARVLVWDRMEEAYKNDQPVRGRVLDRVKGGLAVDVGVTAFLPGSLVDIKPVKNLDTLKGKELEFKIISFDKKRNNIVLSRKAVVEVEQSEKRKQTFSQLSEGKITHGIVKNITDYGVFVDLGAIDGLLHITDISWGRVSHPNEYFNVGDEIEVMVLKFDPVNERVSLGYKQKTSDPWSDVAERYPVGSRVKGRVVSLTDYGAFIALEEGVEGLVHVSEMSWNRKIRPSKLLSANDEVEAVVSDVHVANRRISLSLKALEQNPWDTVAERFPVGSTLSGRVRNLTDFGAFVEVEDGIDGLIHISDMSWTRRVKHPSEIVKKGDLVTAKVTNVDAANQRLSLSIKEFLPNEWDEFAKNHHVGEDLEGTVAKITDFGLFIRLTEGVEGLAHISEIERDSRTKLDKMFKAGDSLRARVIKVDWNEKKIGLSLKGVDQSIDRSATLAEPEIASPAGEGEISNDE